MLEFVISDTLTARLEAAAKASIDFTPAMATIADSMRTNVILNFEAESGPDGERWLPSLRAIEDGGLTLADSGELRLSITSGSDADSAIVGTNKVYAAIHQFGGTVRGRQSRSSQNVPKPRVFPARPFLGFGPDDISQIEGILFDHIDAALKGSKA